MSENIQGKVVVITGVSSGLGEAAARMLVAEGAVVALGARRADRIRALVDELTGAGGKALAVATDMTQPDQLQALVDAAVRNWGRVDVLLNNAGLMPHSPLERRKLKDWNRTIDVNLKGVLHGIAAVLPQMIRQKSGHICRWRSESAQIWRRAKSWHRLCRPSSADLTVERDHRGAAGWPSPVKAVSRRRRWPKASLCAGHARQPGGESPLCNLMEVKHE